MNRISNLNEYNKVLWFYNRDLNIFLCKLTNIAKINSLRPRHQLLVTAVIGAVATAQGRVRIRIRRRKSSKRRPAR